MVMVCISVTFELEPSCAIKTAAEQNAATDERVTVAAVRSSALPPLGAEH